MDRLCNDKLWDSNLTWYTSSPDLTDCFKNTILVWVPSALLLLFLPLEIRSYVHSKSKDIPWSLLNVTNMVSVLILLAVSVTECIVLNNYIDEELHISSTIVKCLTYVTVLVLIFCCRKFGILSSGHLHGFWCFATIAETLAFYSTSKEMIDMNSIHPLKMVLRSIIFLVTFGLFVLSFFADKKPRYWQPDEHQKNLNASPEMWASFSSKIYVNWLNGFIWKATKRTLQSSDIYQLNHEQKALIAAEKLHELLNKRKMSNKDISVLPEALKAFAPQLFLPMVFAVVIMTIGSLHSILTGYLIDFVSNDEPTWKGFLYGVSVFLLMWFGFSTQYVYKKQSIKPAIETKSSIIVTLFTKVLKLSNTARGQIKIGEIINAMSLDTEGISRIFASIESFWILPIYIITQTYILWSTFGVSALVGICIILLSGPLNFVLCKLRIKLQGELMRIKDKRAKTMSEVLSGIRVIKMYGWESSFQKQIEQYREEEYAILKKISYVLAAGVIVHLVLPTISLFSIIAFYVIHEEKEITAYSAFISIIVINGIRWASSTLPELSNSITNALVSSRRINRILNSQEIRNYVKKGKNHDEVSDILGVTDASFGWSKDDIVLRNVSMNIKRGSLVAILGQVGSGKSSLIAAIFGEMEKHQGEVFVNGSTAYVPQQPWILNASLKDNILFGRSFEAGKYRSVIEACALDPDIETLPAFDDTEIGEKGINLSGGQKQRVSLARALYGDFDIYMLDDPLGAVDSHVGKHIFTHVIGPQGLLRNKTRVLVTHNESFLNEVDEVYVMSNGSLVREPKRQARVTKEVETGFQNLFEKSHNTESGGCLISQRKAETLNKVVMKKENRGNAHRLTRDEKISSKQTNMSVYWQYIKAVGLIQCGISFFFLAAQQVLVIGTTYWIALWVDDVDEANFSNQERLIIYAALMIGQLLLTSIGSIILELGGVKASQQLHSNMLSSVLSSPMLFFDVTPSGRILNRFTTDVNETDNQLPDLLLRVTSGVFIVIMNIVAVSIKVPFYVILVVLSIITTTVLQRIFSKSSQQLKRFESATKSPLYSHFSETIAGAHVIRAQGEFEGFHCKLLVLIDQHSAVFNMHNLAICWMQIRRLAIGRLFFLVVCIIIVFMKGDIGPGMAGYIIVNAWWVNSYLPLLVVNATSFETSIVCVERIAEFTHLESEGNFSRNKTVSVNWPSDGKISFKQYFTKYRQELEFVLKDITFEIQPKEKVGVVGRTGSGKSSLSLALFRIIEAASGHIFIDDQNIAEIDLSVLRSRLTIIPQDPVLFSGTLRLNLDPFDQHEDEELWSALEHAHLKPFAASLNDGLQHNILEGGQNLSVGQRQLVCLARALLRKSNILVLDEATASVDYETDELIQNTIRKEFRDCTIITIAHRLNTILDYDRVMVLDRGTLMEFDRPSTLLNDESTLFFGLARDAGIVE